MIFFLKSMKYNFHTAAMLLGFLDSLFYLFMSELNHTTSIN